MTMSETSDEGIPEDKVMIWPAGVFRLTAKRIDPIKVLVAAIEGRPREVLVLGIDSEGQHFAASSTGERGELQALMDAFTAKLDGGEYIG
jgi:hypothetical protein